VRPERGLAPLIVHDYSNTQIVRPTTGGMTGATQPTLVRCWLAASVPCPAVMSIRPRRRELLKSIVMGARPLISFDPWSRERPCCWVGVCGA